MTEGEKRRAQILKHLAQSGEPLSGASLASMLKVSRQVIVQDVALLRAQHKDILSTYKGYVLENVRQEQGCARVFHTNHRTEDTLDELEAIVDFGGRILDVFVEHPLYGQIRADLIIGSRLEARQFVEQMMAADAQPLKILTGGSHYHTVEAPSEEVLDLIQEELARRNYLVKE